MSGAGHRRLALVTGASAGIGAAFARRLAATGFDLVLTARRADRLEALAAELDAAGAASHVLPADLSRPDAPAQLCETLATRGLDIDLLVNNAGYGVPSTYTATGWATHADFLQVMLTGPLELCHRLLPGMAARRWGRIVNVASVAAFAPAANGHTLYPAVKSALLKASQALNVEMTGKGVHVTALCPGFTRSEFHDVNLSRSRMDGMPGFMWQTAEHVAKRGLEAVEANRPCIVTGAPNVALSVLARLLPDAVVMSSMRRRR